MKYVIDLKVTPWTASAQQKRAVRAGARKPSRRPAKAAPILFFKKQDYLEAEKSLVGMLSLERNRLVGPRWIPLDVPLVVSLMLIFPYRKSEPKGITSTGKLIPRDTRPDTDNLAKLYYDCLTKSRWIADDSIIWYSREAKMWGPPDKVGVRYMIDDDVDSYIEGMLDE